MIFDIFNILKIKKLYQHIFKQKTFLKRILYHKIK